MRPHSRVHPDPHRAKTRPCSTHPELVFITTRDQGGFGIWTYAKRLQNLIRRHLDCKDRESLTWACCHQQGTQSWEQSLMEAMSTVTWPRPARPFRDGKLASCPPTCAYHPPAPTCAHRPPAPTALRLRVSLSLPSWKFPFGVNLSGEQWRPQVECPEDRQ